MKKNTTKRALVASILMLCLCFSALIGTTFAWFTDSVTSSGNVIQTGKFDVGMYWAEGTADPADKTAWKDASLGAIFNNEYWEPG
jgi:predicted ribosomally synthesized peptide with SipW-like signal peptide